MRQPGMAWVDRMAGQPLRLQAAAAVPPPAPGSLLTAGYQLPRPHRA